MQGADRLGLLERVRRESLELGIPSIDPSDGAALYTAAYTLALMAGGGVVAVDAGAGIGYSTLWIALGLADAGCGDCTVYAAERDPSLAARARSVLGGAPWPRGLRVEVVEGDALELLSSLPRVDLVFVDIEKGLYPRSVELVEEKLGEPGVALWHNAYFPPPPGEFFDRLRASRVLRWGVAPTPAGLVVAWRLPEEAPGFRLEPKASRDTSLAR